MHRIEASTLGPSLNCFLRFYKTSYWWSRILLWFQYAPITRALDSRNTVLQIDFSSLIFLKVSVTLIHDHHNINWLSRWFNELICQFSKKYKSKSPDFRKICVSIWETICRHIRNNFEIIHRVYFDLFKF